MFLRCYRFLKLNLPGFLPGFVCPLLACVIAVSAAVGAAAQNNNIVNLETSLGLIQIELRPDVAPGHVQNFLNYVNDGDYDNSFIHRSINGFIIQGGGFNYIDGIFDFVPVDTPITNEFALSNVRGTIAMAKVGSDPNSATSQWFINQADNSANLDFQNGGFTVFGSVIKGMDVVDAIAALPVINTGTAIGTAMPVRNTPFDDPVDWSKHLVMVNSTVQVSYPVPMVPAGVALLLLAMFGLIRYLVRPSGLIKTA